METDRLSKDAISDLDIAVIGMSCRFPGAKNIYEFWQNLCNGIESIARLSDNDILGSGVDMAVLNNPRYVKAAPILENPGMFDARFFGFTPTEAQTLDPQHRILLECAHEALQSAGYDPDRFDGRIGVYAGCAMNTYFMNSRLFSRFAEEYIPTLIGNDKDFLSTRISYKLNLRGPSISIQTACSTSLVAIHLACQSLLTEESDMALAGAVSVKVPHKAGYLHDGGAVLSPDGHVRAFDSKANGTVFGSGAGIILLKRLSTAISDRDTIHAVIKGSAVNNDGSEKAGYTAPSVNRQAEAVIEALSAAGVSADSISYLETHGSGTPVGDTIEVAALTKAFRHFTQGCGFCAIGSVKTNVGHLDAAAGIAGVIKGVLALKHRKIPPSLNYSQPNPEIDFDSTPFFVGSQLTEWKSDGPRRAGVMSTGMGGTNACLVLEEAPELEDSKPSTLPKLLVLSAKTETALDQVADQLLQHLKIDEHVDMDSVSYTLQIGRKAFAHRKFVVCKNREEAIEKLERRSSKDAFSLRQEDTPGRSVIFLFPGVGDHYVGMGHDLYRDFSVFRQEVDGCAEILHKQIQVDIRSLLYPPGFQGSRQGAKAGIDLKKMLGGRGEEPVDEATQRLNRTIYAQPALFTIEYALAKLWMSWGVKPDAMVGHSMGEYVAACLAGVFSLEDALRLICRRASLVDQLPAGAMLAVALPEDELLPLLGEGLSISLINGPKLCVVAGLPSAMDKFEKSLVEKQIIYRPVQNQHAFHSRLLDPIVPQFEKEVMQVMLKSPQIPYISNLTGTWIRSSDAVDPSYWARHSNHTARFSDALAAMWQKAEGVLLEIGPGKTLGVLSMQHPGRQKSKCALIASSLRHGYDNQSDSDFVIQNLGRLWQWGAEINWEKLYEGEKRRRIPLPGYPLERKNFWFEAKSSHLNEDQERGQSSINPNIDEWFYVPSWKRSTFPQACNTKTAEHITTSWLIFMDTWGLGGRIKEYLESKGQSVYTVVLSDHYDRMALGSFAIDAAKPDDYTKLFKELGDFVHPSLNIVHLGCISESSEADTSNQDRLLQDRGFFSLLFTAQSIGDLAISARIRIGVISNGIHQVTGEEKLYPEKATILGPCGVMPKEYSNISCFSVDVVLPTSLEELREDLPHRLATEFTLNQGNPVIAYRGMFRWVREFEQLRLQRSEPNGSSGEERNMMRIRKRGVYLISGGTGGIGLTIAKYLAEKYQAKLAFTQRSEFPDKSAWRDWLAGHSEDDTASRKIRQILELEELGAEVIVFTAEAADKDRMQRVIEETRGKFGQINGVIHAAGIIRAGIIQAKTLETVEEVMSPKVTGTLVLNDLLKDASLDFIVLFSSVTSILTPYAEVEYSAANAFMDAFADYANRTNQFHTLTINWPGWREVGQLAEMKTLPGVEEWKKQALKRAILPKDGLEAFKRALGADLSQIIVSPENLASLYDQSINLTDISTTYAKTVNVPQIERGSERLGTYQDPPTNEVEKAVARVWTDVLGVDSIGVHENFAELGGHSLLAMQIITRLRDIYQVDLTLRLMLGNPTIAQLSSRIKDAIISDIEKLSDEEARQLVSSGLINEMSLPGRAVIKR